MFYPEFTRDAAGTGSETVVLEQSGFYGCCVGKPRGEIIWRQMAPGSNEYQYYRLRELDPAYYYIDCRGMYQSGVCRFFEGQYHDADLTASEYSFPDGAWANYPNTDGVLQMQHASRRLQLAVPVNTTRLYLIVRQNGGTNTFNMSLTSGELLFPTFRQGLSAPGGSDAKGSGLEMDHPVLIARNCGGATLTIDPDGDQVNVVGFISITDTPGNPLTGVYDPDSIEIIQRSDQLADGPVRMEVGLGGTQHWSCVGHYTTESQLTGYTESVVYDLDGTINTWAPADKQRTRVAVRSVTRTLTGDMNIYNSSWQNIGPHRCRWRFNQTGQQIGLGYGYNANAVTNGIHVRPDSYACQWGLVPSFQCGRSISAHGATVIPPWDKTYKCEAPGGVAILENDRYTAMFAGCFDVDLVSGNVLPEPNLFINPRDDLGGFPKFYYPYYDSANPYAVADGDVFRSMHWRFLTPRSVL